MNSQSLSPAARRKRYDNIDGTGEMCLGLFFLGFALLHRLQAVLPPSWDSKELNPFVHLVVFMLTMGAVLGPLWALGWWGGKAIKQRITWPRTGYVAYRRGRRYWLQRMLISIIGAIAAVGVTWLLAVARRHGALGYPRTLYLGFWVVLYAYWVYRMGGENRWKWAVLLFMALGLLAIALLVPGDLSQLFWPVMLFLGLVWLISGGGTLYSYIRHTQPPAPETE